MVDKSVSEMLSPALSVSVGGGGGGGGACVLSTGWWMEENSVEAVADVPAVGVKEGCIIESTGRLTVEIGCVCCLGCG